MSGSRSDHQRAWDNLEARREIRELAEKHYRRIIRDGGTLDEVIVMATDFRVEVGLAAVPFHARPSEAPNMIHKYIRTGTLEKI